MNKQDDKILILDSFRVLDKYLVDELKKANIYHRRWISDKQKQFFRGLLQDTIQRRFKK